LRVLFKKFKIFSCGGYQWEADIDDNIGLESREDWVKILEGN